MGAYPDILTKNDASALLISKLLQLSFTRILKIVISAEPAPGWTWGECRNRLQG